MDTPIVAECSTCGQLILSPAPFLTCDQCRAAARPAPSAPGRLFTFPAGIFGQRSLEGSQDA